MLSLSWYRKLDCANQKLNDIVEQKSELEASFSQCQRENDQLTTSVSITLNNNNNSVIIDVAESSRTEGIHSCSR